MSRKLALVTERELEQLSDEELCRRCVEPVIETIRGTSIDVRQRIYDGLTEGQRALLAYWILFGHGQHGLAALLAQLADLTSSPSFWEQLGEGARRLQFQEMSRFLEEAQRAQRSGTGPAPDGRTEAETS